jgi:hypothetical protein
MSRPTPLRTLYAAELERVRADPDAPPVTAVGTPRGWLLECGVVDLVEPFLTWRPAEEGDLARYAGLDGETARSLLAVLPAVELDDRQNDAPTLGTLLRATVEHPDEVELHGYLVGPGRVDERLTAEGLYAYVEPDLDITPGHHHGCECERLWALVQRDLGIDDAVRMPDSIAPRLNPWRPYEPCWSLWWD